MKYAKQLKLIFMFLWNSKIICFYTCQVCKAFFTIHFNFTDFFKIEYYRLCFHQILNRIFSL